MVVIRDWVHTAAIAIADSADVDQGAVEVIEALIIEHCPFKRDTGYVPVGLDVERMAFSVNELLKACSHISNAKLSDLSPDLRDAVVRLRMLTEVG
jgi:hypothetical protein